MWCSWRRVSCSQHHRLALRMNPVMRARSSTCTWWRLRSGEKRILGYAEQPCYLWFVLQLCEFLNQYITSWRLDPANQQKFHIIAQEHHCLPAQNHIRHRDLKPDSIPITLIGMLWDHHPEGGRLQVCDLCWASTRFPTLQAKRAIQTTAVQM